MLDGTDRDGGSVYSDSYGEEGEMDMDGLDDNVIKNLDPEMREKLENGELSL